MDYSALASVIEVSTSLPFPDALDPAATQDHIGLRISSEFTTHVAPVTLVDGEHKLGLVRDAHNQPLLFSIGNGQRFMCFVHESGGADAWQSHDITPSNEAGAAFTFDVTESTTHVVLAVALRSDGRSKLFTSVCKKTDFEPSNVSWVVRNQGYDGPSVITSLLCGGADNAGRAIVTAGIEATAELAATYYQVHTDPSNLFPWFASPLPENAQKIVQVAPGRLPGNLRQGYYCLYEYANGKRGCVFQKSDHSIKKEIQIAALAEVRVVHSAVTPYSNQTDLFVSTAKGIAYFSERRPDDPPQILLPEVPVRQVVVAEYDTTIAVFAVSDANELYYLEGTRGASVTFKWSGLPIRADVALLSVAYNAHALATELMYVDTTSHAIHHLWRDPVSFVWHEAALTVRAPKGEEGKPRTRSFPAYITAISLVNDTTGESVGAGYIVGLSSDLVYVTANDRTYALNKNPLSVATDGSGRVTIVQEVSDALSSPNYTLHLTPTSAGGEPITVPINPAQRVVQKLARFTTAASIQNARTTDGRKVNFGAATGENFSAAASLLGQFGGMVKTVDPAAGKQLVPAARPLKSGDVAYEHGAVQTESCGWFEDAVHSAAEFFGDVWEAVKRTLKAAFKFAVRVMNNIVTLVISVAGKIFSFIVQAVGPLVRAVAGFLKDTLGLDLTGFLDWLGFLFDWDKIKETQQHLVGVTEGLLDSVSDFFVINRPVVKDSLEGVRDLVSHFIKDNRVPVDAPGKPRQPNPLFRALGWLLNNPIIQFLMKYNPITWLMSEIGEIVGDEVQLPDLTPLVQIVADVLPGLLLEQVDVFSRLGESLVALLQRLVTREIDFGTALKELLGDLFWTVFDGVENMVLAVFDIAGKFFAAAKNILTQPIKLPIVTAVWTALTGQELTIMNVLTLVPAFALNAYSLASCGRLPFDKAVLGDPRRFLPSRESLKLASFRDLNAEMISSIRLNAQDVAQHQEQEKAMGNVNARAAEFQAPMLFASNALAPQPAINMMGMSLLSMNAAPVQLFSEAPSQPADLNEDKHKDPHEQLHHIIELGAGLFNSLLGIAEVGFERAEHKARHGKPFIDISKLYSPARWGLIVVGLGQCVTKVVSLAVAPGTLNRTRGDGVFAASCAIRIFKTVDIVCNCVATFADCYPVTPIQPSGWRMVGTVCGAGVAGPCEWYVSSLPPAARHFRLAGDISEVGASIAACVGVVTGRTNPAVATGAAYTEGGFVAANLFCNAGGAIAASD